MSKKAEQFVTGYTTSPDKFPELGVHARAKGFKNIDCIKNRKVFIY